MLRPVISFFALLTTIAFVRASDEQTDSVGAHPLGDVIVTGSHKAVGRNLLPYAVTTVGSPQLEATGSNQLLSALSTMVPSLFVTERNIFGFGVSTGGAGHIKLRGVGGDRSSAVLMMVDGQPQFAGIYSHHVADFYALDNVERVEVLRGPGSVLYGSNAMAGVVNVITKSPKQHGVRTTLSSRFGSYRTWLNSITNTLNYGRFSSLFSVSFDRTDGLKQNFDFKQANAYGKVKYNVNDSWSGIADYTFTTFVGNDPVYPALQGREGVYHQKIVRGEASLTATNNYTSTDGAVRLYYNYGNHFIHDPNYFHSLDDRLGIIVYQNISPWSGSNITFGFDCDRYSGKIPISGGKDHQQAPLATLERKSINECSPYLTFSQFLISDLLALNGGLRVAFSDKFSTDMVPQVGVSCSPQGGLWRFKMSIAKGYRNPSFRELYLYKFANPHLSPETMWNYELSIGRKFGSWMSIDLTGYYAKGDNLIQQTSVSNENSGRFINRGIELSAHSRVSGSLQMWATYSFLHSSIDNLTGAPRIQYYFGAGYDATKSLHIDAEIKGVTHLFVASDVDMQNYATVNLKFSYQLFDFLKIMIDADNLTDAHYVVNKGYPMPGFTMMGGFKLSI